MVSYSVLCYYRDMKQYCAKCKKVKTVDNFSKKTSSKTGYSYVCKQCHNKYSREVWYIKNKDKQKLSSKKWKDKNKVRVLATKYNTEISVIKKLLKESNGKCAICGEECSNLHLDHNHKTNKVRGFLCRKCNSGLGFFNDNITIVESAIKYLKK